MKIHISTGNTKLGKIANISLLPGVTCRPGTPCRKDCYAKKFLFRETVRTAWTENTAFAKKHPLAYLDSIFNWIMNHKIRYFRWHVAGDILHQSYLDGMIFIASQFPEIKFLAFTKKFELDYSLVPSNLTIIFSMWPGLEVPPRKLGVSAFAWMQDGTEIRYPVGTKVCKGKCHQCFECWGATTDVVFKKH